MKVEWASQPGRERVRTFDEFAVRLLYAASALELSLNYRAHLCTCRACRCEENAH